MECEGVGDRATGRGGGGGEGKRKGEVEGGANYFSRVAKQKKEKRAGAEQNGPKAREKGNPGDEGRRESRKGVRRAS